MFSGIATFGAWLWFRGESATRFVYETAQVDRGTIERTIVSTGAVRARITVDVGSQLSGQISQVDVDYNDRVKIGDLLARIDPRRFQTRVQSAEAQLAIARAAVEGQTGELRKLNALLALAERTVTRQKTLAEKGNVSRTALDDSVTNLETARANVEIGAAQLANARAQVEQRQAALAEAQLDLDNTEIRSPIEGIVTVRSVDPGQTVAASLQAPVLFRIAQDLSNIQIEAQVDEADIGQIATGNPVTFTVDAYPDGRFTGEVEQVRLAATEAQNIVTYTVIVGADNPRLQLLPGMTATARIVTGTRADVLRIPNAALRFRPHESALPGTRLERRDRAIDRRVKGLTKALGLDESQQVAARAIMEKLASQRAAGVEGMQNAADRRLAFKKALAKFVSPEQMQRYGAILRKREGTSRSIAWVLDETGQPQARGLRLGIGDENNTEVLSGSISEGSAVIVRARSDNRAHASAAGAR